MTKEVIVSVVGYQFEVSENEPIELVTNGEYYNRNGKHFIMYEEYLSEGDEATKNILKIHNGVVELTKKGESNLKMEFEKGKTNETYYHTPIGTLLVGIHTDEVEVRENERELGVKIQYSLEVNGSHVSACEIQIKISSKSK